MSIENLNDELKAKLEACETAEDIIAVAEENGYELTDEMRTAIVEEFAATAEADGAELDEETLDSVAGGRPRVRLSGPQEDSSDIVAIIAKLIRDREKEAKDDLLPQWLQG